MVKLEHYIRQLIDERGGIDKNIMKSIVSDLEKSALVKRTQKQVLYARVRVRGMNCGFFLNLTASSNFLRCGSSAICCT